MFRVGAGMIRWPTEVIRYLVDEVRTRYARIKIWKLWPWFTDWSVIKHWWIGAVVFAPLSLCLHRLMGAYITDWSVLLVKKTSKSSVCTDRSMHKAPMDRWCRLTIPPVVYLHRWIGAYSTDGSVLCQSTKFSVAPMDRWTSNETPILCCTDGSVYNPPMDRWGIAGSKFSACTDR